MLLVGSATAGQAGASADVDAGSDVLAMAAKMLLSVDAYADEAAVVASKDEVVGRPDAAGQAVGVGADEFVVVVNMLLVMDYCEGIMMCILTASC
ncbi:hypothetical protein PC121_g15781 [Phytophthora cactorum]|nr:hypothetical protein PC120_g4126 [Phytophthora cactorum]KAG3055441.1 hypothetical protein PC121_g15781 [Phytophthora cactorum]